VPGATEVTPTPDLGSAERPDGVDEIVVGTGPVGLAVDTDGAVWVVSAQAETVSRVPAGADEPDLVVDVPGVPLRAVAAYDALWVTSFHGEEVLRLDPATGEVTARTPSGAGPEGMVAAFGALWVVAQDAGRLLRLDPATGRITEKIGIGLGARLVTAGERWLYVSHYRDSRVLRIDPRTGDVLRSPETCGGPQGLAVTSGRVWVACTVDGTVVALDAETLAPISSAPVADAPDAVRLLPDGRVLVASQAGPTLTLIDPADPGAATAVPLGDEDQLYDQANIDALVTDGRVLVSSFASDVLLRTSLP
jgi:DNA-binding beta-propeller fold protein YncE